jgi:hypothetical protein
MPTPLPTLHGASELASDDASRLTFTINADETLTRALDDTPADFGTMDAGLTWTVQEADQSAAGDDTYTLNIRIMSGATVLAAADAGGTFQQVVSHPTTGRHTTDQNRGPTAFGFVNTTADKATWDAANIELQQDYAQNMAADGNRFLVDLVSIDGNYTVAALGDPYVARNTGTFATGATAAGVTVTVGEYPASADLTPVPQVWLEPLTPAAGITAEIGQPAETDTAQPLAKRKTKLLGQPSDTSTAQPPTRLKTKAVGQPADTSTAQPFTTLKTSALGQPSQADTAQPMTRRKSKTIGLVGPGWGSGWGSGWGDGATDVALPLARVKTKVLGQPEEADEALPLVAAVGQIGQPSETDLALPLDRLKTKTIGLVEAAESAQPMTRRKTREIGLAGPGWGGEWGEPWSVSDIAQPMTRAVVINASVAANGPSTVQVGGMPGLVVQSGSQEYPHAADLTAPKSQLLYTLTVTVAVALGQPSEADTAQPFTRLKSKVLGQPAETDEAFTVARLGSLGQPAEADSAQPFTSNKTKTVGQPSDTSTAQAARAVRARLLGQPFDAETALALVKRVTVAQATEADTAQAMRSVRLKTIGQATEADSAHAFTHRKTVTLGTALEVGSAMSFRQFLPADSTVVGSGGDTFGAVTGSTAATAGVVGSGAVAVGVVTGG